MAIQSAEEFYAAIDGLDEPEITSVRARRVLPLITARDDAIRAEERAECAKVAAGVAQLEMQSDLRGQVAAYRVMDAIRARASSSAKSQLEPAKEAGE